MNSLRRVMHKLFGRLPVYTSPPPSEEAPWRAREEQMEQQVIERLDIIRENLALIERRKDRDHG